MILFHLWKNLLEVLPKTAFLLQKLLLFKFFPQFFLFFSLFHTNYFFISHSLFHLTCQEHFLCWIFSKYYHFKIFSLCKVCNHFFSIRRVVRIMTLWEMFLKLLLFSSQKRDMFLFLDLSSFSHHNNRFKECLILLQCCYWVLMTSQALLCFLQIFSTGQWWGHFIPSSQKRFILLLLFILESYIYIFWNYLDEQICKCSWFSPPSIFPTSS